MMTREVWYENIKDSIKEIADTQMQIDLWLEGTHDLFSTPTEAYVSLFAESDFEGFLNSEQIGLTADQRDLGLELEKSLDSYFSKYDHIPSTREETTVMISDPDWNAVSKLAQSFLHSLN